MEPAPRDISRQLARPLQAGDFSLAVQLYRLARTELTASSHHLGGLALFQTGNHQEAIDSLKKAIHLDSENESIVLDLYAMVLEFQGTNKAEQVLEDAIAKQRESISLRELLAQHHLDQNNAQNALGVFDSALELFPNQPELKLQRALCLQRLGDSNQALAEIELLIESGAALPNLEQACGLVLQCQSNHKKAVIHLQKATTQNPDDLEALFLLGKSHRALGNQAQALSALKQVRDKKPSHENCLLELGNLFLEQNEFDQARDTYLALQEIAPQNASLHFNLGQLYRVHNQIGQAIECFDKACEFEPNNWSNHFAKAFTLPILYHSKNEIAEHRQRFSNNLEKLKLDLAKLAPDKLINAQSALGSRTNFHLAYQESNDRELQRSYGELSTSLLEAAFAHLQTSRQPQHFDSKRRIRVGFVSSFFWKHTVGKLFSAWITQLDSSAFEIAVFSTSHREDDLTATIKSSASTFLSITNNVEAMSNAILDSQLDILIYPEIGMNAEIAQLAGLRLAPIQCSSWGHPITPGLASIDYFLSSELMEPADSHNHYNEQLISLPNLSIYYETPQLHSDAKARSDFGLPENKLLFLCCQSLFKYLPHYDSIWSEIAAQVPESVFVFIANKSRDVTAQFRERFIRSFDGSSLDGASRLVIVPQLQRPDYFELNRMSAVYLDSLGWSGGNTTLEALTFSLPIVTWEGEFMRGRHSGAILRRLGLEEEIADTPQAYINKAIEYGLSKEKREAVRAQIEQNKHNVFEDKEAIRGLEDFIRTAVEETKKKGY